METETLSKRKKRKTRRCLDEIRKRSRGDSGDIDKNNCSNLNGRISRSVNLNHIRTTNNFITNQRITLLPKSIRSETITRPTLGNRNQELHTNHEIKSIVPGNSKQVSNTISTMEQNRLSDKVYKHYSATRNTLSDKENFSDQQASPSSLVLFSPMIQPVQSDTFEESVNSDSISTLTTPSSSQSSREGYGYHLYVDFMNEIPTILKETAPGLIKEDVMKRTKNLLHNIYVDDCHQESEDNVMQCIKSSVLPNQRPSVCENVEQNPMEYLKFGYAWQKRTPCSDSRYEQSMSNSSGSMETLSEGESARGEASGASSGEASGASSGEASGASSGESSERPSPAAAFLDTPDYNYYPHKLNQ